MAASRDLLEPMGKPGHPAAGADRERIRPMPKLPWRKPTVAPAPSGFRNRIVGVCRFSYPALSGYQSMPKDVAAVKAVLYDPARLERRFHMFERLMLPSLQAQTDQDFQMGFVIGDDFPKPWRQRLEELLKRLPNAYLHAMEPAFNFRATHAAYKAADLSRATHLTSFRLDDDDAMDMDFIARLRRQAEALFPINRGGVYAIGQNNGFWLELGGVGNRIYDVHERTPACGVALVAGVKSGNTVYIHNHRDMAERFNTYLDAETPAFIRTVHRDNDAKPHVAGKKEQLGHDEIRALVARNFPFTVDDLLRL